MAEKMEPGMSKPWPGPEGLIPVTSGNTDDANIITRQYLDQILVEMRILDTQEADLTFQLWGRKFASPIMTPAFSHLNKVGGELKPMIEYAIAAKQCHAVNWVGMETDEDFANIVSACPDTIRIIKPFADHKLIEQQIHFAQECGALAVGIDIDHIIGTHGHYDIVDGFPMGPITTEDLKYFVSCTELPFIAKGVLSRTDAVKCAEAGVSGIVFSHHHGRLSYGVPPLMVLQESVSCLKDHDIKLFVDCHMDTGYDAYKALALGADAVCVGRPILPGLLKEGSSAVVRILERNNRQLKEMMGYTGVKDLHHFDPSVLIINGRHAG